MSLLQTLLVFGQTSYMGTYVGHKHFSALTICFNKDSAFYAKSSGCKSWNKGSGRFPIHKKQLALNFTDSIIPYTISKTVAEQADSVSLRITVG